MLLVPWNWLVEPTDPKVRVEGIRDRTCCRLTEIVKSVHFVMVSNKSREMSLWSRAADFDSQVIDFLLRKCIGVAITFWAVADTSLATGLAFVAFFGPCLLELCPPRLIRGCLSSASYRVEVVINGYCSLCSGGKAAYLYFVQRPFVLIPLRPLTFPEADNEPSFLLVPSDIFLCRTSWEVGNVGK